MWNTPNLLGKGGGGGTLDTILRGLGAVMQVANFYKDWQTSGDVSRGRKTENLGKMIGLAQSVNQPGDPTQITPEMASQWKGVFGQEPPKQTQEGIEQAATQKFMTLPRAQDEGIPGQPGYLPAAVAQAQAQEGAWQQLGPKLGTVGESFKPILPRPHSVGILGPGGEASTVDFPAGVKEIKSAPRAEPSVPIMDVKGNILGYSPQRPAFLPQPKRTDAEEVALFEKKEGLRQTNRKDLQWSGKFSPDPQGSGLPVPTSAIEKQPKATGLLANMELIGQKHGLDIYGNPEHFKKAASLVNAGKATDADKQLSKLYLTAAQAFAREEVPQGTDRSAWIKARVQQDLAGIKSMGEGGTAPPGGGEQPPPKDRLQEGQITHFANGQSWKLQNGQPVRVK